MLILYWMRKIMHKHYSNDHCGGYHIQSKIVSMFLASSFSIQVDRSI